MLVEDRGHDLRDLHQPDLPFEERHHRHFVGCIEHGWIRRSQSSRPVREVDRREGLPVELLEREHAERREGQPPDAGRQPVRERQRELDGQPHVGRRHLGGHAAVSELGDPVDDGLGVHDHVDQVVVEPEQVVRLDHLQTLVHERCRVDGDLRSHVPRWVGQRLLDRCLGQLRPGPSSEGPARSRDNHAVEVIPTLASKALSQSGVLGVDRDQSVGFALDQVHDQLAPHDQRFLVSEGQHLARLKRRQGRSEPHRSDHGIQHHVGVRVPG